jgi:hypothetical protein
VSAPLLREPFDFEFTRSIVAEPADVNVGAAGLRVPAMLDHLIVRIQAVPSPQVLEHLLVSDAVHVKIGGLPLKVVTRLAPALRDEVTVAAMDLDRPVEGIGDTL